MSSIRTVKQTICTNCGEIGHHYRSCSEPITSYGILAFRIPDSTWNQADRLATHDDEWNGLPIEQLEYLCIQRRDSIGYVEMIRAKYKLTEIDYIQAQLQGCTSKERHALLHDSFYSLWTGLWGPMNTYENKQYKQEYEQAKNKFESLRTGFYTETGWINLQGLLESIPDCWTTPEWGFPKGRRNPQESDFQCALREFCEETGLESSQVHIFTNIHPIREVFVGNNNIRYCHVYYLAWISNSVDVTMNLLSTDMMREIGDIAWFTMGDALQKIRPSNPEKRTVLQKVESILRNTSPLLIGPIHRPTEQKEELAQNRKFGHEQRRVWGDTHTNNYQPTFKHWNARPPKPIHCFQTGTFGFVEET